MADHRRTGIFQTLFVLVALGLTTLYALGSEDVGIADAAGPASGTDVGEAQVEYRTESVTYGEHFEAVAAYRVVDGSVVGASLEHIELWSQVHEILPVTYANRIRQFGLFAEGPANTVAMVHQSGVDSSAWILSIDVADAGDRELLAETLVHEVAHLATLHTGAFTFVPRITEAECDGIMLDIGCAHPGSLMAEWIEAFWPDVTAAPTFDADAFVAQYATTAPHEDLAETFLHWAHREPVPFGSVLADKYAMFDANPELVDLRDDLTALRAGHGH
ncbi:MAG: hypothetical protein HKN26_00135 [Acidimicrobiales bacterium]|nr:hypothetical protein [Acidimicrobiales bacterium]